MQHPHTRTAVENEQRSIQSKEKVAVVVVKEMKNQHVGEQLKKKKIQDNNKNNSDQAVGKKGQAGGRAAPKAALTCKLR